MQTALRIFIRAWQLCLSPLFGTQCRFTPSCSRYAAEAVQTHGSVKGSWFAVRRILRCHPFAHHGFDPVPPSQPKA